MKKREKKGHDLSLAAVALLSAAALGAAALNLPRAADTLAALGLSVLFPAAALSAVTQPQPLTASVNDDSTPGFENWYVEAQPETAADAVAPTDNSGAENIPAESRGTIVETSYSPGSSSAYFWRGSGALYNKTETDSDTLAAAAALTPEITIELNSDEPQVLIYHTHATECYDRYDVGYYDYSYSTRSTDNSLNMVSVGAVTAAVLNANGICTVQSDVQHDYPAYNGAYSRSRQTIAEYLALYPSISVVLDLHRDGIESDGVRYKPVVEINGQKAAQFMIISGIDDGTMEMPNCLYNLRLAGLIQDTAAQLYPGLARPVLVDYRRYNQNMSTGALLIEIGSHGNSLAEAQYTGRLLGEVLVAALKQLA